MERTRKGSVLVGLLAVVLLFTGCWKHTYTVGKGARTDVDPVYSSWHSHWLFATIGDKNLDIKQICPSGNAVIKDRVSFLNGLVGIFIGIIYYPSTVEVYCDKGGVAYLEISKDDATKLIASEQFMDFVKDVAPSRTAEMAELHAQALKSLLDSTPM